MSRKARQPRQIINRSFRQPGKADVHTLKRPSLKKPLAAESYHSLSQLLVHLRDVFQRIAVVRVPSRTGASSDRPSEPVRGAPDVSIMLIHGLIPRTAHPTEYHGYGAARLCASWRSRAANRR